MPQVSKFKVVARGLWIGNSNFWQKVNDRGHIHYMCKLYDFKRVCVCVVSGSVRYGKSDSHAKSERVSVQVRNLRRGYGARPQVSWTKDLRARVYGPRPSRCHCMWPTHEATLRRPPWLVSVLSICTVPLSVRRHGPAQVWPDPGGAWSHLPYHAPLPGYIIATGSTPCFQHSCLQGRTIIGNENQWIKGETLNPSTCIFMIVNFV